MTYNRRMKLILLVLASLLLVNAQPKPEGLPGDVFLIDPATTKPFLWIHAASGMMEPTSGYKPEQIYRLLLEREQACWSIHQEFVNHVNATLSQKPTAIIPTR